MLQFRIGAIAGMAELVQAAAAVTTGNRTDKSKSARVDMKAECAGVAIPRCSIRAKWRGWEAASNFC
jgi:hypothetical protein